jgi:hypothetical protein
MFMTKSYLRYFLICIVLLVYSSCENSNSPVTNDEPIAEIMPLAVNNSWTMQFTHFDSMGNPGVPREETISVCCDTMGLGKRMYNYSKNSSEWYFNDASGLWRTIELRNSGFEQPFLYRKYPCEQGEKFGITSVISIDTLIKVKYGSLNCILYQSGDPAETMYIEEFMKPEIGTVKSTIFIKGLDNNFIKFVEYELVDFHLSK